MAILCGYTKQVMYSKQSLYSNIEHAEDFHDIDKRRKDRNTFLSYLSEHRILIPQCSNQCKSNKRE